MRFTASWLLTSVALAGLWTGLISWQVAAASAPETAPRLTLLPAVCDEHDPSCEFDGPVTGTPDAPAQPRGYTTLANPAIGQSEIRPGDDPLAAFSRRPLDQFIIPEGGLFMDPLHADGPHYGVDYAAPEDYLNGKPTYFHPIGPGYVTARGTCVMCFAQGDAWGRVITKEPRYNFGWGSYALVETPYSPDVSIYVMYAHLARDFVSLGDYVTPDDIIGVVGTTGYSEVFHLHMEVRYGTPGRFWNADFSQRDTLDRWLATMFANPALLVFPENHPAFVTALAEWIALQPRSREMP